MAKLARKWLAAISIVIVGGSILTVAIALANDNGAEPPAKKENDSKPAEIRDTSECRGTAGCFTGRVTKIVDGDTIDVAVNDQTIRIRLALTNTPERGQLLYSEAKEFTARLCPVGSTALVDQDDGQTRGSYDRMVANVYCDAKLLNAELLYANLAVILTEFCDESEFAAESWAGEYGC